MPKFILSLLVIGCLSMMTPEHRITKTVAAVTQTKRRPNILFIMPDQLRAQSLGCMGNTDVKTPNIDRLAAEGLLFKQTFANTPVCCPARANLLTGKYANKNGMTANDFALA